MTFDQYWEEKGHFGSNPEDVAKLAWDAARAWQPMETAPKDGTKVLLFGDAAGAEQCTFLARFKGDFEGDTRPYWHWGAPGFVGQVFPTHWQPLPDPPTQATGTTGDR